MKQDDVSTITVALAIWAAIGPLLGIFIGNYLVRSFQRRQWLTDERVKEWREVLTTLTSSMLTMIRYEVGPRTPELTAEDVLAHVAAGEVLSNRLFIAQEIRRRQLYDKWVQAVKEFEASHDATAFGTSFGTHIRYQIEEGARTDISKV